MSKLSLERLPSTSNMRNAKNGVLTPKSDKMRQNAPESAEANAKNMVRNVLGPKLY